MDPKHEAATGRDLYTQTRLKTFRDCPRKAYLRYERGIDRARTPQALRMGSAYHLGQEYLSQIDQNLDEDTKRQEQEKAILAALEDYNAEPPPNVTVTEWAVEREQVGRMLQAYAWRWSEQTLQIEHAEIPFKVPIKEPGTDQTVAKFIQPEPGAPPRRVPQFLAGMVDKIVKLDDGRRAILEHKTTGESIKGDSRYWQQRQMDQQTRFYFCAAQELGLQLDTILYDVIRKPQITPKTLTQSEFKKFVGIPAKKNQDIDHDALHKYYDESFEVVFYGDVNHEKPAETQVEQVVVDGYEAELVKSGNMTVIRETPTMYGARLMQDIVDRPDVYFRREELPATETDLMEFRNDVYLYHQMYVQAQVRGQFPKNTDHCTDYGGCQFWHICSNNVDIDRDGLPEGFVELSFMHTELQDKELHREPSE